MQKYANLVELETCYQTHIFLQNFDLIQPRTSPPKIPKILQNFAKFAHFANPNPPGSAPSEEVAALAVQVPLLLLGDEVRLDAEADVARRRHLF